MHEGARLLTDSFKARIKRGVLISHDFAVGRWPACKAPGGGTEADDPDMDFDCTRVLDKWWDCVAPGFGQRGGLSDYGNGSIFVHDLDGIERMAPWTDLRGCAIHEGDTIRHPSGEQGTVVFLPDEAEPGDAWRVDCGTGQLSRLCLQIGDKGQAVVATDGDSNG